MKVRFAVAPGNQSADPDALAAHDGVTTAVAADRLAERRIADVSRLRRVWLPA